MAVVAIELIEKTPGVLGGRARVRDRRIAIWHIVNSFYQNGLSLDQIVGNYDLSPAEVYAALAYYHQHQEEIDRDIQEQVAWRPPPEAHLTKDELLARWRERTGLDPYEEMTATQAAAEYGVSPQAVREACQKEWIASRKSGKTWLIKRFDAQIRWGNKEQGEK